MLHRLSLRVIPQLSAAVTESGVRRRKRLVMLVPGLVAFVVYRLLKLVMPLTDPWVLLGLSGLLSALAALWAFRMGRQGSIARVFSEESLRYVAWIVVWIGFVYGVQLSLMVLALLAIFVQYDFLVHPDGPAMMALIISCTAVTRDAFELGHVRRLESKGTTIVTQPDGQTLRGCLKALPFPFVKWGAVGLLGATAAGWGVSSIGSSVYVGIIQALGVSVLIAFLANAAFLSGQAPGQNWSARTKTLEWWKGVQFWVWPCLTFALTYYLVVAGIILFLLQITLNQPLAQLVVALTTGALMTVYFYYLGTRVLMEGQVHGEITEGLRRCPFVMEILTKTGWVSPASTKSGVSLSGTESNQIS